MFRYRAVKMINIEGHICYGLLAENLINGSWQPAAFVSDVSCNEQFVLNLAAKCIAGQLDPIHIRDVVIDAIS